jgi:hypothetical protein
LGSGGVVEISTVLVSRRKRSHAQTNSGEEGFAVVTLVALLPLLLTVFIGLACGFYIMKRKILAGSLCLRSAVRLQNDLKDPLQKLLRMNTRARILRANRESAESGLKSATASGYPPAIAAAEARLIAVIFEQTEFRRRQLALLMEAERLRAENSRDLRSHIENLNPSQFRSRRFYTRPLAVEPLPQLDLSPNYEPVPGFTARQQQSYAYRVDLLGTLAGRFGFKFESVQEVNCAASLEERGSEWGIRILAAKAP